MNADPVWLGSAPWRQQRRVQWGECDPAGVVYTPRFADYLVEAFHDFLAHLLEGPLQRRLAELDLGTPAKGLNLLFTASVWPDQPLDLVVRVAGVRHRSFDIALQALDAEGAELFTGLLGLVCVHHTVRESRPIPSSLRERLCLYRDRYPVPTPVLSGRAGEPAAL